MKMPFFPVPLKLATGTALALAWLLGPPHSEAFSLLGPYAPWMDPTLGYHQPGDIGGPMNIGESYRWNVPVITYAFDQSFLNFFGSNGVAQVTQAIQVLNDLPPASSIDLTTFPLATQEYNPAAGAPNGLFLYDLKTVALGLLLEQMGLTQPTRNMLALRRWDPILLTFFDPGQGVPDYVLIRNFDPETLMPSRYVNNVLYAAQVFTNANPFWAEVVPFPIDPDALKYSTVAEMTGDALAEVYKLSSSYTKPPLRFS